MADSPEKRMSALARVLARALEAENETEDGSEESQGGESILDDPGALENVLKSVLSRTSRVVVSARCHKD